MKTYQLTPDQFNALRTKLLTLGVTIPSDASGDLTYKSFTLGYAYNGLNTLTITIKKKPFLIPAGEIWKHVDTWMVVIDGPGGVL